MTGDSRSHSPGRECVAKCGDTSEFRGVEDETKIGRGADSD